jgi:hypothetical protein
MTFACEITLVSAKDSTYVGTASVKISSGVGYD